MADLTSCLDNKGGEPLGEGAKNLSIEDTNIVEAEQNNESLHGEVVNSFDIHTKDSENEEKTDNDEDTGIDNDESNRDDKNEDDSEPVEIEPEEISNVRSTSTSEGKGEIKEDIPSVDESRSLGEGAGTEPKEEPAVSNQVQTLDKQDREDKNGILSSEKEEELDDIKVGFLPSQEKRKMNDNSGC
ncbi:uncharacterized protein LOC144442031 [Glandiceps talaboti]